MLLPESELTEKGTQRVLPNPELGREPCVSECEGCRKRYDDGTLPLMVCVAYESPKAKWRSYRIDEGNKMSKGKTVTFPIHRNPCNFATHVKHTPEIIKAIQGKRRYGQQRHA